MKRISEVEIAGIGGRFSRPENKVHGLHLLAEMSADAQLESCEEEHKELKDHASHLIDDVINLEVKLKEQKEAMRELFVAIEQRQVYREEIKVGDRAGLGFETSKVWCVIGEVEVQSLKARYGEKDGKNH